MELVLRTLKRKQHPSYDVLKLGFSHTRMTRQMLRDAYQDSMHEISDAALQ